MLTYSSPSESSILELFMGPKPLFCLQHPKEGEPLELGAGEGLLNGF